MIAMMHAVRTINQIWWCSNFEILLHPVFLISFAINGNGILGYDPFQTKFSIPCGWSDILVLTFLHSWIYWFYLWLNPCFSCSDNPVYPGLLSVWRGLLLRHLPDAGIQCCIHINKNIRCTWHLLQPCSIYASSFTLVAISIERWE